jgi:hypothetical protein
VSERRVELVAHESLLARKRSAGALPESTSSVSLQAPRLRASSSTRANIFCATRWPRWLGSTTTSCTLTSGLQAKVEKPSMQLIRPTGVSPSKASTLKACGRAASAAGKPSRTAASSGVPPPAGSRA